MDVEKLRENLNEISDGRKIVLVIANSKEYSEANLETLKYLITDKRLPGIYVTVNKPYETLNRMLEKNGIDTDRLFFLDGISREVGSGSEEDDNVYYLDSPQNLTNISIALSEIVKEMPEGEKFLIIDSMSSLTIYNQSEKVSKFARHITGKMRKWNITGLILSIEEEVDDKIVSHFTQFCDEIIRI